MHKHNIFCTQKFPLPFFPCFRVSFFLQRICQFVLSPTFYTYCNKKTNSQQKAPSLHRCISLLDIYLLSFSLKICETVIKISFFRAFSMWTLLSLPWTCFVQICLKSREDIRLYKAFISFALLQKMISSPSPKIPVTSTLPTDASLIE